MFEVDMWIINSWNKEISGYLDKNGKMTDNAASAMLFRTEQEAETFAKKFDFEFKAFLATIKVVTTVVVVVDGSNIIGNIIYYK